MARELLPAAGDIIAETPLTRLRQVEAARRADAALARAADAVAAGLPVECAAADARDAAQALAELTGAIAPDGFFLLAATGLSHLRDDGGIDDAASIPRPLVLRVLLPR